MILWISIIQNTDNVTFFFAPYIKFYALKQLTYDFLNQNKVQVTTVKRRQVDEGTQPLQMPIFQFR
jgi:hypothetical protein